MTIAGSNIAYAHEASREQARARQARSWHFLRPRLRVASKYICTSKDCLESVNLNTWNSFDFLSACWESALSWKAGKRNE
jgi:hypothetical protein